MSPKEYWLMQLECAPYKTVFSDFFHVHCRPRPYFTELCATDPANQYYIYMIMVMPLNEKIVAFMHARMKQEWKESLNTQLNYSSTPQWPRNQLWWLVKNSISTLLAPSNSFCNAFFKCSFKTKMLSCIVTVFVQQFLCCNDIVSIRIVMSSLEKR